MAALSEGDRPKPSDTDFEVDEVVLAFHGNLLYEARVLAINQREGGRAINYTVHFQGWKKSWDESVSHDQVFEHNDDNLRIAHRLLNGAKMRQQALQPVETEKEEKEEKEKSLPESSPLDSYFQIPPGMQRQLVDDWEYITKERMLVPLPRTPSVQQVLEKWINARRTTADKATREVAESLQMYFNAALPKILLYRFERHQYNQTFHSGAAEDATRTPSTVYGPEHLLRLVLKLPYLMDNSEVDRDKMQIIANKVNELTKYLQKNGRILFLSEYVAAPEEYLNAVTKYSEM